VRQRRGLAVAAELAGLHVDRVLSAPLALALGLSKQGRLQAGRYLVYDLGASFFDVSVVEFEPRCARILSTDGDSELAGAAYDRALLAHVITQLEITQGVPPRSESEVMEVLEACETAKCTLSENHTARIVVQQPDSGDVPACEYEVEVSRTEAERLFGPLVAGSLILMRDVLSAAQITAADLDGVLVVGAHTAMPLVQRTLAGFFGDRIVDLDARTATAQGAAWAAQDLDTTSPFVLEERLGATMTVAALGAKTQTLVPRGTILPAAGRIQYCAQQSEDLHLYVFEGEHLSWQLDEPVAHLVLEVPSGGASWPWHVDIDVEVNECGRLEVIAQDTDTGDKVSVRNVPEFSRQQLTAHFAQAQARSTGRPPPTHGPESQPATVDPSDESYN
jgi:molecular chaperone DnaK (HSP70)